MRCHGPIINIATTRRLHTFYCSSQLYQVRGAGTCGCTLSCVLSVYSHHISNETKPAHKFSAKDRRDYDQGNIENYVIRS